MINYHVSTAGNVSTLGMSSPVVVFINVHASQDSREKIVKQVIALLYLTENQFNDFPSFSVCLLQVL